MRICTQFPDSHCFDHIKSNHRSSEWAGTKILTFKFKKLRKFFVCGTTKPKTSKPVKVLKSHKRRKMLNIILRSLALCLVEHSHLGPPVIALRKAHRLCDLSTLVGLEVFVLRCHKQKISEVPKI